ncbi:MAG: NAD(P) transhydrogenase subunit alpha [Tannerellaceae bacterium]|jgi:NAD(P) transhydrogenase subunit alpha|nr:NAD(P) transhydrogenase subunit alpha [Tannerellaceae bacterium]
MNPVYLVLIFLLSSVAGYFIIKNVPSLLHTPLMTGMNALSGVCLLGAVISVGYAYLAEGAAFTPGVVFGGIAIFLATVNVVAGFGVTHRMLKMFNPKGKRTEK